MNKLNLEIYKKDKEEFDKKIRSLDYKIVETSVEMYNQKMHTKKESEDNSLITSLSYEIEQYENEKGLCTKDFLNKINNLKSYISEIIENKIKEQPNNKDYFINVSTILNKISNPYFNINDLDEILNLLEINNENNTLKEENVNNEAQLKNTEIKVVQKEDINNEKNIPNKATVTIEKPFEVEKLFNINKYVNTFDIEEQRIVDFENLLNYMNKISKDFRTDIEKALSRFIINYKIVKNTQYLQNDFDNIANRYIDTFSSAFKKFNKDENIEAIQVRMKDGKKIIEEKENEILTNDTLMKELQRKMTELASIYFVGGYARKILCEVAKSQGKIDSKKVVDENKKESLQNKLAQNNTYDSQNNVFKKIKKLCYDKRLSHIIEVSKWTKNVEEKLKYFYLEETDFQFVIYLIRQTENICNQNFEEVSNLIISLCDANIELEVVEENENLKNKKLQEEAETTKILQDGIENIKKKYSKIPFIGRKVLSILSAKMLKE